MAIGNKDKKERKRDSDGGSYADYLKYWIIIIAVKCRQDVHSLCVCDEE